MSKRLSEKIIESTLNQCKPPPRLFVGYSGGLDSHVLLHLCASTEPLREKMTAVYINHGLQPEAESWAEHCRITAENLGVYFIQLRVNATALSGESPEDAARKARYNALKSLIGVDDALLIGQHRDDQMETVLLQLFRGSGLRGLSGIPESMNFGSGLIHRPLLHVPKEVIKEYAKAYQLKWIEDPSNQRNDFDRNYLRNVVIPLIKQRWEVCDKTVARSARHCAEAQILVSAIADELFDPVFDRKNKTLCISQLKAHKNPRQKLIIRHWFQSLGLKMPAQDFVERIQLEVIAASENSDPVLLGQACSIRRYRDKLYCLRVTEHDMPGEIFWPTDQATINVLKDQTLSWLPSSTGIPYEHWQAAKITVKFRSGGEKISLPGRKGHHSLKKLYQEAAIPPWEREQIPLIYLDDKLAAVGDLWISAEFYEEKCNACLHFIIKKTEQHPKDNDENVIVD